LKNIKKTDHQPAGFETFSNCIINLPASTVLVLLEDELKDTNPLLKAISFKAKLKTFPLLKAPELREWINKRLAEEGGTISLSALNLLVRLIGSNLWVMSSELNKLVSTLTDVRLKRRT